jgi:hypothetical protein
MKQKLRKFYFLRFKEFSPKHVKNGRFHQKVVINSGGRGRGNIINEKSLSPPAGFYKNNYIGPKPIKHPACCL